MTMASRTRHPVRFCLSWPAIPYVIADSTPGQPYGNSTLNATQKRVFAAGRYAVQS